MDTAFEVERLSQILAKIQGSASYRSRDKIAEAIAAISRSGEPRPSNDQADELRERGIIRLGAALNSEQAIETRAYFERQPCFPGHVALTAQGPGSLFADLSRREHHAGYRLADVLAAPHLLELANQPDVLATVESYLGCTPTLYSMNAFWSFPEQKEPWPGLQTFHRDYDDFRFCTLFLFLTDTSPDDGAHYIVPGTHRLDFMERAIQSRPGIAAVINFDDLFSEDLDQDDACRALFSGTTERVTGKAGSAVIEDTYALHKGDIPKTPRLLVWIRYGLYKNMIAQRNGISPTPGLSGRIPASARHRYINRLLLASG